MLLLCTKAPVSCVPKTRYYKPESADQSIQLVEVLKQMQICKDLRNDVIVNPRTSVVCIAFLRFLKIEHVIRLFFFLFPFTFFKCCFIWSKPLSLDHGPKKGPAWKPLAIWCSPRRVAYWIRSYIKSNPLGQSMAQKDETNNRTKWTLRWVTEWAHDL